MTEEIWKDVAGYEGLYQVSNLGNVKSITRMLKTKRNRWGQVDAKRTIKGRFLPVFDNGHGYKSVNFSLGNNKTKKYYIHRLVATAFIQNPYNMPEVNHKDLNKKNNNVDNLEWCSRKENINHAIRNGVDWSRGKKIMCVETGKVYRNSIVAGKETGILSAGIRMNLCGKHKYAGGYHWIHV